jgi:hypothetical protein
LLLKQDLLVETICLKDHPPSHSGYYHKLIICVIFISDALFIFIFFNSLLEHQWELQT